MSTSGTSIGKVLKWILISLLFLFTGTALYFIFQGSKAVHLIFPDIEDIFFVNARIKHDSAYTKLKVVLQNRNPYRLNIDTLSFEVKLNDTSIASQIIPLDLRQTSFESDTTDVPLNLSIKKIQTLLQHLKSVDSTYADANGYVVYKTVFGRTKLNFKKRKRIEVPRPPRMKLLSLTRDKFDLKTKTLKINARLEIINPGKHLNAELSEIKYELNINNELHSKGSLNKIIELKPLSNTPLDVPLIIKVDHPLKTKMLMIINRDRLPYELFVRFTVKERISKKRYNSPVELEVTGKMELQK